jgi:hypothetical protein
VKKFNVGRSLRETLPKISSLCTCRIAKSVAVGLHTWLNEARERETSLKLMLSSGAGSTQEPLVFCAPKGY